MVGDEAWTVQQVLLLAEEYLKKKGRSSLGLRSDLSRALGAVLGLDRLNLLLQYERLLNTEERAKFRGFTQRMARGEPLAYLLGEREFYGRSFGVGPEVLIPRPETELLVEKALELLPKGARVFEPCTGSGCIGITLVLERKDLRVVATDLSPAALDWARKNAERLGADMERLRLVEGSFWKPVGGKPFDALIANPPYVDPKRPDLLAMEVRDFEPHIALFGPGGDPLGAYRELLMGGVAGLVSGALILFELGVDTAEGVLDLIRRSRSYEKGCLLPDLAGHPRMLLARRKPLPGFCV